MEKIMIIGCPGSGKSTLSKKLANRTNYPVLHLDYIYHIDNFKHINSEELKLMVESFTKNNEQFIIDGNYGSTLEWRIQFCDTVILLDIDSEICVNNVLSRMNEETREDIAEGFDNSIIDEKFIDFVRTFQVEKLPQIKEILNKYEINQIILRSYEEYNGFLKTLD